ncbi:MAG: tryptophan synthase subunit alpha [Anaerolineales bacterium]|nr:tryptophan synthase subunit alpha [Anaerolineales bacterium]
MIELGNVFKKDRTALMPYYPVGYPNYETSIDIIEQLCLSGADIVEVGVPFSDPLADGPTIQAATQISLQEGTTLPRCISAVEEVRSRGVRTPLVLMSYYNPILRYGVERFAGAAGRVRANGFIVPDLPPEESATLREAGQANGLSGIVLLTPHSPPERVALVTDISEGFVYLVSVTGITGARRSISTDLESFIRRVREKTSLPLAVGFGISNPEQVSQIGRLADGVIIGSALIDRVNLALKSNSDPVAAAGKFLAELQPPRPETIHTSGKP